MQSESTELQHITSSDELAFESPNTNNNLDIDELSDNKDELEHTLQPAKKKRRSGYTAERRSEKKIAKFLERALSEGIPAACKHYEIPYTTGYSYVRKWDAEKGMKSLERKPSGPPKGKPTKLLPTYQEYIINQLKENNTLSGNKLAGMLKNEFDVSVSKSTINTFLKSEGYAYKTATTEDVVRNTDVLIDERYQFAVKMLEQGLRPEDSSLIVYWDVTHFLTNIHSNKARALIGQPAVVPVGHRGIYIPVHESESKRATSQHTHDNSISKEIPFADEDPSKFNGTKASSLSVCCAMTGNEILLARSQFRHFTSEDMKTFFQHVLDKLEDKHPGKSFLFIGDNENVHDQAMELFLQEKYKHHTLVPNPRYSPFLNAIEYLFNQLKFNVAQLQYDSIGKLLLAIKNAFKKVQPHHLSNYHKTVHAYLLQCLKKEPIHSWKKKLPDKDTGSSVTEQEWDFKHRSIWATEREIMGKPIVRSNKKGNEPKKDQSVMYQNGQAKKMYQTSDQAQKTKKRKSKD